jgi:hypothetical protein
LGELLGEDVVRHRRNGVVVSQCFAERKHQRRLSGSNGSVGTLSQQSVYAVSSTYCLPSNSNGEGTFRPVSSLDNRWLAGKVGSRTVENLVGVAMVVSMAVVVSIMGVAVVVSSVV